MKFFTSKVILHIAIYFFFIVSESDHNSEKEYVILTRGFSSNPETPRIGIKMQSDSIYFCEERKNEEGTYNYFSNKFDKALFSNTKKNILEEFKDFKCIDYGVKDDTHLQLIYNFVNGRDTILCYHSYLTSKQSEIVQQIEEMKLRKLHPIKYYPFPEELLKYKLPEPPTLESLGIKSQD